MIVALIDDIKIAVRAQIKVIMMRTIEGGCSDDGGSTMNIGWSVDWLVD